MKRVLFVVLILVLGVLSANAQRPQRQGGDQTNRQGQRQGQGQGQRMSSEEMIKRQVDFVKETLGIEGEQLEKVKKVYEDQAAKMKELRNGDVPREQMREKFQALRAETDKALKEVLTEEQIKKLDEARKELRQNNSQSPRGEGRGGSRGGTRGSNGGK